MPTNWSDAFRRAVVCEKSWRIEFICICAGLALATASRWVIDRGANGVEFATFFPVIVLAAVFLSWASATLVATSSFFIAVFLFMGGVDAKPTLSRIILALVYVLTVATIILAGQALRVTIRRLNRQLDLNQEINRELQHRAKNALQVVKALASRAARADDPVAFYKMLAARLDALVSANEMLGITKHSGGDLGALVEKVLSPFHGALHVEGPPCWIGGDVGMALTLVLHELATNATKYGALSHSAGQVDITWRCQPGIVTIEWNERGGPPVLPPIRRGLGSHLLVPHGTLKVVELDWDPEGLGCRIVVAGEKSRQSA